VIGFLLVFIQRFESVHPGFWSQPTCSSIRHDGSKKCVCARMLHLRFVILPTNAQRFKSCILLDRLP